MTRAELEALAVRVETEEPSVDLNEAILLACGWTNCDDGTGNWLMADGFHKWEYPCPTASLDAAVPLVPDGWFVDVYYSARFNEWSALLEHGETHKRVVSRVAGEDAEPRARTAAALRARAQEAGDE